MPVVPVVLAYRMPPSVDYQVKLVVDGNIPVMGGQQGTAQVDLTLNVKGGPESKATYELTDAGIAFNQSKLSFLTLDQFTKFFPKTSLELAPSGKVVSTTAVDSKLPVRLPGLDQKRLPETTFLPVELPAGPVDAGFEWTFSRPFSGSDAVYTCRVTQISGDIATLSVKVKQDLEYDENESQEAVKDKSDAVHHVKTSMIGEGSVVFSLGEGAIVTSELNSTAVSQVTDLETKQNSERKMTSRLSVSRKSVAAPAPQATKPGLLNTVIGWGKVVARHADFALALLRSILTQFLGG